LSRADVHGVVSFYHDFRPSADPRPEVQVCRAEACKARGVEAIIADAEKAAGERVRVSTVYCVGLCSAGPAARVGDRLHARLDSKGLVEVIENARGLSVLPTTPWPVPSAPTRWRRLLRRRAT